MSYPHVSPLALFSLLAMLFLAAIDTTILTTAMPLIVKRLGNPDLYHWVFTAFMLASTLSLPFYGKFADEIGIKRCMTVAGLIFIVGSALCMLASDMLFLVLARAIQGLGAGGIQGLTMIAFGALFPPEERGAKQSLISVVWGVSSLAGPATGGYLVQQLSWRWIFGLTVAIGIVALSIFWLRFPEAEPGAAPQNRRKSFDMPSIFLLMSSLSAFILLSGTHQWLYQVVGYTLVGFLFWGFIRRQKTSSAPLIPLELFKEPLYCLACLVTFTSVFVGFAALTYIPMYLQNVRHFSPDEAGVYMTPMMLAWPLASATAGFLLNRIGLRWPVVIGTTLCGLSMMAWYSMTTGLMPQTTSALLVWCLLFGLGMGGLTSALMVTAQTLVRPQQLGVASSTLVLLRSIGTTLGISLMGNLQVLATPLIGLNQAMAWVFAILVYFTLANVVSATQMPNLSPKQLSLRHHAQNP